jgi:hypothetical protein
MAEPSPFERDMQLLESELRRLEAEYHLFFANRLPRPPLEARRRVERLVRQWDRADLKAARDRFRFGTLQARFTTLGDLWDRALRAREEGRAGPLGRPAGSPPEPTAAPARTSPGDEARTVLTDPRTEPQKVDALYRTVSAARASTGEPAITLEQFTDFVRSEVRKLRARGAPAAACHVAVVDGRVRFSIRSAGEDGTKKKP